MKGIAGQNFAAHVLRTSEMQTDKMHAPADRSSNHLVRMVLLGLVISLVLCVVGLLLPGRAAADNYSVVECEPGQDWAGDFWNGATAQAAIERVNWCGPAGGTTGWGLGLRQQGGVPYQQFAHWSINAPAGLHFSRLLASAHVLYAASMTPQYYTDNQGFRTIGAWNPNNPELWYAIDVSDFSSFGVYLVCGWDPQCVGYQQQPQAPPWGAFAYLMNIQMTVRDGSPPSISATGGSLLAGGTRHGRETVGLAAGDTGSGMRGLRVYINGALSRNEDLCPPPGDGRYRQLQPCPGSLQRQVEVDTERDPGWTNGPNDVRICSFDVSGQESTSCIHQTVQVDNSCPASGGGTPASHLDAGVDDGKDLVETAAVRSTDDVVVRGQLRDSRGTPVSGAMVCVFETVRLDDASRELAATAITQGNGRFATQLDRGPSRDLQMVYRYGNQVLDDQATVRASVVPTLGVARKSLHNGESEFFSGVLPGPRSDGRSVALQARVGRKWRTFKQLTTDSRGRFRGKYKFVSTFGAVRYRFRALVKRQGGYPYEPGFSRGARVLVRG
jgi:hypothetical protein